MRKRYFITYILLLSSIAFISFNNSRHNGYNDLYKSGISDLSTSLNDLHKQITTSETGFSQNREQILAAIRAARKQLKKVDFWLRYMDPNLYKKINGPLPVEWETEVFEKFEKPYERRGAGLSLATLYLQENQPDKDSLALMIKTAYDASMLFSKDTMSNELSNYSHFFLCNRLFLLNLAAIYTTGFENPERDQILPELKEMLQNISSVYASFNASFPETPLTPSYLNHYGQLVNFVISQPTDINQFDHFHFLKDYVNPLFQLNQELINQYNVATRSLVDYTLSKNVRSIFDKNLYIGQNAKGIFRRMNDSDALATLEATGRMLFYDPILSGNNMRSCASCHKPDQFFADTSSATSLSFKGNEFLARNTPSLINAGFNHLLMLDGKHISLQSQAVDVINNPDEMNCATEKALAKVLSCKQYKQAFKKLLKYTPQEKEVTISHITSAITYYYSRFSNNYAPFDNAMNNTVALPSQAIAGFNLFMGKAQCATCHFVPQFNGVKPPYVGSEFEVLGVPGDTSSGKLSPDNGRYNVFPVEETKNAFRTGSLRNTMRTMPYMHNGVFKSIDQVIDFYNNGGGKGLEQDISNQTLSADSLHLTTNEKADLIAFLQSLNEDVISDSLPTTLPKSKIKALNKRKPGGDY
jgi:cytochrome c peroxidase